MTATPTTDAAALTDADLAAITARATLATTGPWTWTWGDYGRGGATLSHDPTPELGFPGHDVNVLKTTDDWAPLRCRDAAQIRARALVSKINALLCPSITFGYE